MAIDKKPRNLKGKARSGRGLMRKADSSAAQKAFVADLDIPDQEWLRRPVSFWAYTFAGVGMILLAAIRLPFTSRTPLEPGDGKTLP